MFWFENRSIAFTIKKQKPENIDSQAFLWFENPFEIFSILQS